MPATGSSTKEHSCIIVVPCYNEEKRLRIDQFASFLESFPAITLLFVNDGSRDNTLGLIQEFEKRFPDQVMVLDQQPNAGKAEAVRAGMLLASNQKDAKFTGFWDADLATPLDVIPKMERVFSLRSEIEMIFGARVRLLGRWIDRRPARHYLGRCFATCASLMLRLPIYDTQCGAKMFRITPGFRQLLAEPFQSRWIFDVELIARFLQQHRDTPGYVHQAIYEWPLERWEDVAGSKLSSWDFLRASFELTKIRRRYLS